MSSIQSVVWTYIDRDAAIQRTLLDGLVNVSALARRIARERGLEESIEAVVIAIRRYEGQPMRRESMARLQRLLRKAKITTKTKLASLILARNDRTEKQLGRIYEDLPLARESTLRIFEVSDRIKIICDEEHLGRLLGLFTEIDILEQQARLSEIAINYPDDITKIPGVFAMLANEMALNGLSMIDSMICHREHIIIFAERDLEEAFSVVLGMTKA